MFVVIEGRHKNKKVVEKYVDNLFRALKINRLQRLVHIKFKGTLPLRKPSIFDLESNLNQQCQHRYLQKQKLVLPVLKQSSATLFHCNIPLQSNQYYIFEHQ